MTLAFCVNDLSGRENKPIWTLLLNSITAALASLMPPPGMSILHRGFCSRDEFADIFQEW